MRTLLCQTLAPLARLGRRKVEFSIWESAFWHPLWRYARESKVPAAKSVPVRIALQSHGDG